MPEPSKYVNRVVKEGGRLVVLCESCVHVLSKGRGKYKLVGISEADCQECGRMYVRNRKPSRSK